MQGHPHSLIQIAAFMRRNALRYPDRDAYITGASRMSWRDADQASDRLAWRLRELGIGRGDHVAILGNNSANYILVTYALHKLGAAAVILNAALKSRALATQVNHADAKALVSGDGLQEVVDAVRAELDTRLLLTWDAQDRSEGVINLDLVIRDSAAGEPFPIEAVAPDDIACLIFSSGTTGTPKGAINTWWNLLSKNLTLSFSQELKNTDIGLFITPLCMGGTQLMSINPYIMLGIPAVVMPSFDAGETLRVIEAERVTTFFAVPTMINAMVSHADFASRDLSSLTRLVSAGGPLPTEVFQRVRARGIGVLECFGTSESGGGIMHCAAEKDRKPDSVGRPMAGFEVRIVDDEGRPVPDGEVGEFIMRGDPVASGYYKQPAIEAEMFRQGWFHTGDYGRRDAEGFFYVMDRKKDMVKTGGLNVFPKDVEELIYAMAGVSECSVLGLPHAHWGEAVTAFVSLKPGCALNEAAVIASLRESLSNYQVPKAVIFLDELPKTIFGKLSKLKLREDYEGFYRGRA
jgi:acyl-CoA synthetase (AMP-forming)/AMP-acid ligase II